MLLELLSGGLEGLLEPDMVAKKEYFKVFVDEVSRYRRARDSRLVVPQLMPRPTVLM